MPKARGPTGSVQGVPEDEVTNVLVEVVTRLAEEGLDFERARAREIMEEVGVKESHLDGFLFSLQRTIPGVENTGYGQYRLPEDWYAATRCRLFRYRPPPIDVLAALRLRDQLEDAELPAELEPLRDHLDAAFAEAGI